MLNRFVLSLVAIVMVAGLLLAHGEPIMGTVTAVGSDTVTIKDKDNKSVVVMLEKDTKYPRQFSHSMGLESFRSKPRGRHFNRTSPD